MIESPFCIGQPVTYDNLVEILDKNPNLVSFSIKQSSTRKKVETVNKASNNIKYVGSVIINKAINMTSVSEIMQQQKNDQLLPKKARR